MKHLIQKNRAELIRLLGCLEATDKNNRSVQFEEGVEQSVEIIMDLNRKGGKLIFVGNGGSAAIASHMATDFLKNVGIPAISFNDSSLITCLSNDLGYENVFSKPVEKLPKPEDVLVAISSSGQSANILKAVKYI